VWRDGRFEDVSSSSLVPGDIVQVPQGVTLPCDLALMRGSCVVNESMLTGESVPVVKNSVQLPSWNPAAAVASGNGSGNNSLSGAAGRSPAHTRLASGAPLPQGSPSLGRVASPSPPGSPALSRSPVMRGKGTPTSVSHLRASSSTPSLFGSAGADGGAAVPADYSPAVEVGMDPRCTLYAATRVVQLKPVTATAAAVQFPALYSVPAGSHKRVGGDLDGLAGPVPVLAMVVRTGFATTKGALILSIMFPKPSTFKFVEQSYKFLVCVEWGLHCVCAAAVLISLMLYALCYSY